MLSPAQAGEANAPVFGETLSGTDRADMQYLYRKGNDWGNGKEAEKSEASPNFSPGQNLCQNFPDAKDTEFRILYSNSSLNILQITKKHSLRY